MANILKQIKVGNTTYDIEPVTAYLPLTGGTVTGELIMSANRLWIQGGSAAGSNSNRLTTSSGMPGDMQYNNGKRGLQLYSNGIALADPYNGSANNDSAWIRHLETTSNAGLLEIAAGDDGGNEEIRFRYYDTSNNIAHDILVPKKTGTIALTSDIPTSLPASDVYAWAKAATKPTYTKAEVGLGNVDNTADANKNVNYANSAGSVAWGNVTARPITITQRNNDSPISGAYAWGTHVTIRNANNWFEMYAPHMGTSSDRVYMQTGWDNDRQGWKAIAWTSDIPTSLPASDVYAWAKSPTKPSYTKSEVGLGNVDNTADANKNVNYANSAGSAGTANYATTSHLLRTYNAGDGSHGEDYYLKCKYNVDGDSRFKLHIIRSNGAIENPTSVDYANSAGTANYFNYGRGAILANSSSFTNNFCKDIFGEENNNNYHLVALRTNSQAPSSLLGDYSSGIAWKGSDTYGSLMVRYNTSEIRVSGGNGANTNPKWTVDLVHSGNIGSQNVNYANTAGSANSVAWGNVSDKPDLTDKTYVDTQLGNVRNSISGLGSALNNKADKGHTHSYLPLSGGSMTGTLDLASSSNGIKFNSTSYYVTNMESGSVDVTLGYALGNETSKTVSFHGGSKGSGTWHVVAQADGVLSDNVSIGVTSISNTGFTIWVKNVLAGSSSRTLRLHYIAVKYY